MSGLETVNFDKGNLTVNVAIGAASANGAIPADAANRTVMLSVTSACYFKWGFGAAPTATTADIIIPGPWVIFLRVPSQATHWAVLQVAAGGFASMTTGNED